MGGVLDSKTTQDTSRTISGASGHEQALQQLFAQLAKSAGGQLGDLSGLASGQLQGPTAADQSLVEQSFGATADMARRGIDDEVTRLMSQLDEQLASRGIQGSSIESVNRGQVFGQGVNRMADVLSQLQGQQGQALMNLPFQRAQTQLGANNALFQQIAGLGSPVLNAGLQERLNTINTSTTSTTHDPMAQLQLGMQAAGIGGDAAKAAATGGIG